MGKPSFPSVNDNGCRRRRVAEGEIAAVDRCACGTYQVHLGAFTLRLAPDALESLRETLERALIASEVPHLTLVRSSKPRRDEWAKRS